MTEEGSILSFPIHQTFLGLVKRPMGIQFVFMGSDQPQCGVSVVTLFSPAKELPILFEAPLMLLMLPVWVG